MHPVLDGECTGCGKTPAGGFREVKGVGIEPRCGGCISAQARREDAEWFKARGIVPMARGGYVQPEDAPMRVDEEEAGDALLDLGGRRGPHWMGRRQWAELDDADPVDYLNHDEG